MTLVFHKTDKMATTSKRHMGKMRNPGMDSIVSFPKLDHRTDAWGHDPYVNKTQCAPDRGGLM